ncbi:hypothetical protein K525DRAFT_367213 [Schizophyllum commune Loenen D]|nr:hypothetical protein K525DRAFT_367213 [Schizophyllum commune Loenen D]
MASVALDTMPPWPESSPNRRIVNAMSFYDTLMYDASTPYDAPDPYDAPNAYENTLASLLDTDFPLPASPSRRGVLSPSLCRVLSRKSSSKSVFGDSTNIFNDGANIFNDRTGAGPSGSPGDSGENFFIDPKYAPSDRTESTGDLTGSVGDLTESSDEVDPTYSPQTVLSFPSSSTVVFGGTAFATDLATFTADIATPATTNATFMTLPTYTILPTYPELPDKPPALAIAPEGSIGRDMEEVAAVLDAECAGDDQKEEAGEWKGNVGRSFAQIYPEFQPEFAGFSFSELSFQPLPPSPLIHTPNPTFAPARAQSPASAIEFITRPHSFATDPAPCDPSYPAPSDPHCLGEDIATHENPAAQDGLAAGVQNNGDVEDNGDAENNGDARDGTAAERARDEATAEVTLLTSQPTSPATVPENDQTKPPRKARKSKGKAKAAVEDAIAHRATANTTAAQPAPHAPVDAPASHSVATAVRSDVPASHSDVPEYAEVIEQQRQAKKARKARGTKGRAAVDSAVNAAVGIVASAPVPAARSPTADVLSAQPNARAQEPAAAQGVTRSSAAIGHAAAGAAQASHEAQVKPLVSKSQQVLAKTSGVAAPPTASMAMSFSMPALAQAMGMPTALIAPRVTSALHHGHAFPAAAPSAASFAPQPSLSDGSMGTTISFRSPAPPTHASSGSSKGPMLWQALMKGELTMEEMQARLRSDVKSPPALEGARADVLRSVTLSEGPPVAPPSFRSPGTGVSSATSADSMRHATASSSSTTLSASSANMRAGSKRSHDDIDSQDPNSVRCEWTHFVKGEPMGPCTHLYNKQNSRDTLKSHVLQHMHMMEPNLCDGIYCQWAHRCRRPKGYCVNLRAVVDHIVEIILDTNKCARH